MAARVTARHAMLFTEAFNGPDRALPPHEKRQCQSRNARAEARAEKRRILMSKMTAEEETKAEERAWVSQHQAAGL